MHVHESPLVMLVPLGVLALGAVFAGWPFAHFFIGDGRGGFWRALAVRAPTACAKANCRVWVELAPLAVTIIGFAVAYYYYILHPGPAGEARGAQGPALPLPLQQMVFRRAYDFLFVRPAFCLGRFLWKSGDGMVIDGLGPDGIAARVLDAARGAVRLQSGYVYHYAFAMLLGVVALATWFMVDGRRAMSRCRLLSLVTFLPLFGASAILLLAPKRGAACALDRAGHHHRHLRRVAAGVGVIRSRQSRLPAGRAGWLAAAAASPTTWAWTAFPCCSWCSTAG